MEADRDAARVQQRVVEVAQREGVAQAAPARPRAGAAASPCPAGSSAGRSACRCSGAPRPWPGDARSPSALIRNSTASSTLISPRCSRMSRMIRQARQIASVYRHHAVRRGGVEALLAHHLLAVHAPALDELRRVDQQPGEGRMRRPRRTTAGGAWVRLVDAGVADGRPVVLQHRSRIAIHRRRDDVDAPAVAVELGRAGSTQRTGSRCAGTPGVGTTDSDSFAGHGRDAVLPDEVPRAEHRVAIALERLLECGRVVFLHPVKDLARHRRSDRSRQRPGADPRGWRPADRGRCGGCHPWSGHRTPEAQRDGRSRSEPSAKSSFARARTVLQPVRVVGTGRSLRRVAAASRAARSSAEPASNFDPCRPRRSRPGNRRQRRR